MVEHSPKILASEQRAITTISCAIAMRQCPLPPYLPGTVGLSYGGPVENYDDEEFRNRLLKKKSFCYYRVFEYESWLYRVFIFCTSKRYRFHPGGRDFF